MAKHRIPNANKENVICKGPYDMFYADEDEESREAISMEEPNDILSMAMMRKLIDINENMREEMKEMKKSIEENNKRMKKMEAEMNKIMNKMILKDEAEGMINKVQQDFIKEAKRELKEARKPLEDRTANRGTKSYSDVTKRRKEGAIVVRPNKQQER